MLFVRFAAAEKIDSVFALPSCVGNNGAEQVRTWTEVGVLGIEALQIAARGVTLKQRIETSNKVAVETQTV